MREVAGSPQLFSSVPAFTLDTRNLKLEAPAMFLGFDSSTQSLTAVIIDPASGRIVLQESVNFGNELPQYGSPSGFIPGGSNGEVHADPLMWLDALDLLLGRIAKGHDLSKIEMIAGSGQQHGSVYLDGSFDDRLAKLDPASPLSTQVAPSLTRPTAPIWMDTSTGEECQEITRSLGSAEEICRRSGSIAIERFTGPQIRRFAKHNPDAYNRTTRIHMVSSFIASVLAGESLSIDFGDGAGMNLLNLASGDWDQDLLDATAPELRSKLTRPASATTPQGTISGYFVRKYGFNPSCRCALFTGDNPASLVGMGATAPGNIVISLGTSDTFFASMPGPKTDPNGFGHVFGNPVGGFMSLICFRNGSLAREALRDAHKLGWSDFEAEALAKTADAAGQNLMLPFYGPEITPRHDFTRPTLSGSPDFENGSNPALQVRALLEGQFLNMRLHSQWMEVKAERIRLTGGASKNNGIAQLVADVFQAPVERLEVSNSAALGAALIAATAAGHDIGKLQATFCQANAGGTLQPHAALAPVYEHAMQRFKALVSNAMA